MREFRVNGGYEGGDIEAEQSGETPLRTVRQGISWESTNYSYALEYATTTNVIQHGTNSAVAGPWLEVQPLMANPYVTNPVSGAHLIYRLHRTY